MIWPSLNPSIEAVSSVWKAIYQESHKPNHPSAICTTLRHWDKSTNYQLVAQGCSGCFFATSVLNIPSATGSTSPVLTNRGPSHSTGRGKGQSFLCLGSAASFQYLMVPPDFGCPLLSLQKGYSQCKNGKFPLKKCSGRSMLISLHHFYHRWSVTYFKLLGHKCLILVALWSYHMS